MHGIFAMSRTELIRAIARTIEVGAFETNQRLWQEVNRRDGREQVRHAA